MKDIKISKSQIQKLSELLGVEVKDARGLVNSVETQLSEITTVVGLRGTYSLDSLRMVICYLLFDLEATSREADAARDTARKLKLFLESDGEKS